MAKAIAARTLKMMDFIRKHPNMPVPQIAHKFNIHVTRIYQLKRRIKDEDTLAISITDPTPGPTPEHEADARASSAILDAKRTPEEAAARVEKYFPTKVDAILEERGGRYGTFESNARTCQRLKNVLHSQEGWYRLSYVQREAVEMMMHKISRLVNGDATYLDTVVDIAGYNQLMLDHMRTENEGKKME